MSITLLRIHNLSSTGFRLVLLELPASTEADNGCWLSGYLSGLPGKATLRLSKIRYPGRSQSFVSYGINLHVSPLAIVEYCTNVTTVSDQNLTFQDLRKTIRANVQRYCFRLPQSRKASQKLKCLEAKPKHQLVAIGIHKEDRFHVAICDSIGLNCWMKNLKDETPLSVLSIPGTHNSPTCYKALPSVRCQGVNILKQLENGVRFLDVRLQPVNNLGSKLKLVHSVFPVSLTGTKYFHDLLAVVYDFLERNPSEAIIMSIKREGAGSTSDAGLARILHDHYTTALSSAKYWYIEPRIPSLKSVRGKIVLLRRYRALDVRYANRSGINAGTWADNTPYELGEFTCVQDFYKVMSTANIERKIGYVKLHLARAASNLVQSSIEPSDKDETVATPPLYLNFLSGNNFWNVGCWPDRISKGVNPCILEYLVVRHAVAETDAQQSNDKSVLAKSTGVLICDWVGDHGDWNFVRCIIAMNRKLMIHEMHI